LTLKVLGQYDLSKCKATTCSVRHHISQDAEFSATLLRTANLKSSLDTYSEIMIAVKRYFSSPGRIALPVMGPGRKPSDLPDT
jgi:hypothetical protein